MLPPWEQLDCYKFERFRALIARFSLVAQRLIVAFSNVDVRELPTVPVMAPKINAQVRGTCYETLVGLLYQLVLIRC